MKAPRQHKDDKYIHCQPSCKNSTKQKFYQYCHFNDKRMHCFFISHKLKRSNCDATTIPNPQSPPLIIYSGDMNFNSLIKVYQVRTCTTEKRIRKPEHWMQKETQSGNQSIGCKRKPLVVPMHPLDYPSKCLKK